ncbi:MAG: hypothetical protein EAZ07_04525 [Cytophagales bacterium]|nr:MAG: hypothetical protein EAZ07_04525 [Cytophagales bacterium]
MKIYLSYLVLIIIILVGFNTPKDTSLDYQSFKSPEKDFQLHTWWHWMQGNITKEGITKDLEMMKVNGIVQATILNIGLLDKKEFGIKRVLFDTPEWYEMFKWALEEASRLGIKIGVHNSDGWSSSGGPWIQPEQSMKVLTWSSKIVQGGNTMLITLPKPAHRMQYYEDIAVFAVSESEPASLFSQSNPIFKVNNLNVSNEMCDGSLSGGVVLKYGDVITIKLDKPIDVDKISIAQLKPFTWSDPSTAKSSFKVFISKDDLNYNEWDSIDVIGYNTTKIIPIKAVKSQYFKLKFTNFPWSDSYFAYSISEIELLNKNESPSCNSDIQDITKKISFTLGRFASEYLPDTSQRKIANRKTIELSKHINKDGTLNWNVPKGTWKIVRLGYTTTGTMNAPATAEGEGLECDKMDTSALSLHFSNFSQKLINTAPKYLGNTFKFFLIDSWECGFQNWTKTMPQEFEKRRGYSIGKFYPVLCGIVVNNTEESEAFLYDYRKTIAELIEENYYGHFSNLCHKNKLEMHAEVIYGTGKYPPLDILKTSKFTDMCMFEFWAGHNGKTTIPEYTPKKSSNLDFPVSATLFYGKKTIGAEAYTAMAHYSDIPFDLKPFGDASYSSGINQFILHSYVHQPTDSVPGFTLGGYASLFNRNNPWFQLARSWSDYHARIQYLLQKGDIQADILYYVGDQFPQYLEQNSKNIAPSGYQSLIINSDILVNKLKVVKGKLQFKNNSYQLLYLPKDVTLNLSSLLKIEEYIKEGVIIYGYKPLPSIGLINYAKYKSHFDKVVNKLWTQNEYKQYEKGFIYNTSDANKVISKIKLNKDFSTSIPDSNVFLFTHRSTPTEEIYFVCNQTNKIHKGKFSLRTDKRYLTLWDPITGEVMKSSQNSNDFNFEFTPYQSMFFVCSNIPNEKVLTINASSTKSISLKNTKVEMSIPLQKGVKVFKTDSLIDIITHVDNDVKFHSGVINYKITFDLSSNDLLDNRQFLLNIGDFSAIASLTLNGLELGQFWIPNKHIAIPVGLLKTNNVLIAKCHTNFRNRIIGDYVTYGKLENVWTTQNNLGGLLSKNHTLRTSGIKGPLSLEAK